MINAINGQIVSLTLDSITILTNSGVEYFIEISQQSSDKFMRLKDEERESVRVLTVLQHREDSMTLFGFYDESERYIFNELQTVPGIAARGALKILSGITIENLMLALDKQDVKTLSKVPGVGNKTAQKLILQLRNELVLDFDEDKKVEKIPKHDEWDDLVSSFIDLGYERRVVIRELNKILEEKEGELKDIPSQKGKEEKILPLLLKRLS